MKTVMRKSIGRAYFSLILLMVPCSLGGQAVRRPDTIASPQKFVEEFYQWYAARAQSANGRTSDAALKFKSSDFSPQLARLLKENSAAQDKCAEVVGLDFDPILSTQDPWERYEVGGITQRGQDYKAEIYGVESGKRREKPDVIAEFQEKDGHWFFVNFYYPIEGTDLMTILKAPRPPCSAPRVPTKK